jgi:hypothetical protein
MAKLQTRQQFIDYCLRRLGHPVIQINVSTDQINDRIDDALEFFGLYHYEGTEKIYMKHNNGILIDNGSIVRMWFLLLLVCFLLMILIHLLICSILDIN